MKKIAPKLFAAFASALAMGAHAAEPALVDRMTTVSELFEPAEAATLARTLPADQPIHFRVRLPGGEHPGVLVFVRADDSGELPAGWDEVLERHHLAWIAAQGYGNRLPTAQRMLVAVRGLRLAQRELQLDTQRRYIGGMSGGGRVASEFASHFPRLVTGAIYVVGVNFWTRDQRALLPLITANRYVFVTGEKDFNRDEMRKVFARYQDAGATRSLLLDVPGLGHEYPDGAQLERALGFLDAR
jgi:predicted esterase